MRVLKDLQSVVGKTELQYTLNTVGLRQAKRKSKRISGKVKGLFEELGEGKHSMTDSKLPACELVNQTNVMDLKEYGTATVTRAVVIPMMD
jgi:hypothetical protein